VEVYEWFGCKLHIVIDSSVEVALAYEVTSARVGDNEVLGELLEDGKTLRVECELDCRRFPQIPRATKKFERLYRDRGAVERVNARLGLGIHPAGRVPAAPVVRSCAENVSLRTVTRRKPSG